ncbi:MAG: lamin tail domain-containing protein [Bacteroidales bacterium]|nr:lamin tail domain-containing protein [Bacteroidales bacterium]
MKKVILVAVLISLTGYGHAVNKINPENCRNIPETQTIDPRAKTGDIVISEIMADPMPAVSLPEKEYIEIYNRTGFSFDIGNWKLHAGERTASFPQTGIGPGEYLILCSQADTAIFRKYGRVAGLKSFPALPSGGTSVYITDGMGLMIHGLQYSSDWYNNKLKDSGGWSLEIIDTDYPFFEKGNWEASSSKQGGTPGKVNSASRYNPDHLFYGIENAFPEDSITIYLEFSEYVADLPESGDLVSLGEEKISAIISADPLRRRFMIKTNEMLRQRTIYELSISRSLTDFSGNIITRGIFRFGVPEKAERGDISFNELLFNPFPDEPDYLELYNCSEKTIDASQFYLVSINTSNGDTSDIRYVSDEQRCIIPGSFYAVTTDPNKVLARYFSSDPEAVFWTSSLPSMPNDKGHILLLNREMDLIDEVSYSEKMHYSLLSDNEGVSLEKIRPCMVSDESMNWHSASESAGWGTPGAENSGFSSGSASGEQVIFSSGRISPDNDGYEDLLVIDFRLEGIGNIISVDIFDETGLYVRKITENYLAGAEASLVWDATSDDGSLVKTGIYIVLIRLYNDKGKIRTWKKVCTVIR